MDEDRPLDASGNYTDAEVRAVLSALRIRPGSQRELRIIMRTATAQGIVLRLRCRALWAEAARHAPFNWVIRLAERLAR